MSVTGAIAGFRAHASTTRPSVRLVVLAALVALFALLPLLFMVAEAAQSGGSDILRLVFRARVAELLGNTL
ncbi:MAG: hypothetical protein ACRDRN_01250, partial [Sciscionella sp.]